MDSAAFYWVTSSVIQTVWVEKFPLVQSARPRTTVRKRKRKPPNLGENLFTSKKDYLLERFSPENCVSLFFGVYLIL